MAVAAYRSAVEYAKVEGVEVAIEAADVLLEKSPYMWECAP